MWSLIKGRRALISREPCVEAVKKLGGTVRPIADNRDEWEVEFHLRGQNLTDDGLAVVARLKNVVWLNLRDTKISDAGLAHLKGLTTLQRLHLERTTITDQGVAQLTGLANLEYLNLYATNVTDKSLSHLKGLKKLRRLYVWQTKVTKTGADQLKESLPGLRVVMGVDLSKLPAKVVKKPARKPVAIKWTVATDRDPPKSKLGINVTVHFQNKTKKPVKLYWMTYGGQRKLYGTIAPGTTRRQNSYSEARWLITNEKDERLGFFVTSTAEEQLAVIPAKK